MEVDNVESSILMQIHFLENIKHYSQSGSTEDRENLDQLVASIRRLGDLIPEVNRVISEITQLNSSITYSPTKLRKYSEKAIQALEKRLEAIRGTAPLEESSSIEEIPSSVQMFLDFTK